MLFDSCSQLICQRSCSKIKFNALREKNVDVETFGSEKEKVMKLKQYQYEIYFQPLYNKRDTVTVRAL